MRAQPCRLSCPIGIDKIHTGRLAHIVADFHIIVVQLRSLLGGRAAEQLVFGTMTTGAANDIQRATALARNMVALYGMSEELGLMAPAAISNQYLEGQAQLDCSPATAGIIDSTVQKILDGCYADSIRILTENRALLDEISQHLLIKETITGEELMGFVNPKPAEEASEEETPKKPAKKTRKKSTKSTKKKAEEKAEE